MAEIHIDEGLQAFSGESPIRPEGVQKYPEGKFRDALEDVSKAMLGLAKSLLPSQPAETLYPVREIQAGDSSWQDGVGGLRQAAPRVGTGPL